MIVLLRRDNEEKWVRNNPILYDHELVVVKTIEGIKHKIGDGVTHFEDLPYLKSLDGIDFFNIYYRLYNGIQCRKTIYLNPFAFDNEVASADA